jgi:hypothetical protein
MRMAEIDMKKKLVELLTDCEAKGFWSYGTDCKTGEHGGHEMTAEDIADYLVENIGSKWISVNDRLPLNDTYVNVTTDGVVVQAYWHNDRFYAFTAIGVATVSGVTHWMPLPQPPKGE